ncbi:trichohyalin-like [Fundulus heteroclitus]|uniref:trichohyalin-like n=1 Tax=Fundulus heteroclitus TaxID=8078 RepID=UPI00165C3AA3|nr:trichohyalin-like [Fundulus heteroclitus]
MDERDRSKMQLDNLELTSSSPRTEKKRHSERKRQPRQETEMLENPSENQRAHMENHKQPCSSTKVQGRTSQGVGLQTTPNDNEVLQKTRHREKCKKIVFENLAMVMKKEAAKKRLEERALSKTVDEREYERKMKEKQMKRLAAASKSVDTTSDCQTRSANHGREKGYATQTQEAQTFRKSAKKNIVLPPAHQQTTKEAFAYDKQDTLSTDDKLESNQTFEKLDALKQTTPLDSSNLDCAPSVTQGERQQGVSEERNSAQSTLDVLPEESEACLSKKGKSREQRKRIVQDQIAELRKKEAASQALIEEKLFKDMAEMELEGETLDQRQWEIKAARRKSLTAVREDQIQYKKQKKMETDEAERKERQALLESDRVYQVEQTEKRRQKTPKLSHANSNTSGKEKHDPWLDRPLSHAKERKSSGKDKTVVDQSTNDQNIQRETCGLREGSKSKLEILEHDGEKYTPEKVKYREKCKKIVCDTMVDIREKEAAKVAVVQENLRKALEEQEFAQETRDRKEREKSATMRKDLTETWVSQIQAKKQKKMETDEAERTERQALLESDRLYQIQQSEKRRQKTPKLSHANSNTDSRKEKRDPWLDRPHSHTKEQKPSAQDQNLQTETCESRSGQREGSKSKLEILEHDGEKYTPEKVKSREKCKKIVCDTMVDIREKEAAKVAVVQENLRKALEEQEFAQETRDRKEREKSATMRKDLTETWVSQIQAKKQKKMETDEAERKARQALLESDRLYQIQQSEKRRQKTFQVCEATSTQDFPKDKHDRQLKESDEKLSKQEELELEQLMQDQFSEEDEDFDKFEFLQDNVPESVKSRERRTKRVSEELALIRKREAAEMALLEENLLRNMENQEAAATARETQEKEKKAAIGKVLTEAWDYQVQYKEQQKKERCETECKERRSLIELDRLYEIEKQKRIELQKKKASVNREKDIALAESRRAKIRNQSHGGMKGAFPPLMPLKSLQRGATSDANVKHVDPLPKPGPLLQRRHNLANRPPPSPEPPIPNRIVLDGNSTASIKTPFKLPSIDGHVRKTPMPFFEFSRPRRSVFKEDSTATEKTTLKLPPIHSPPSRPARSRGQKTNQGRL